MVRRPSEWELWDESTRMKWLNSQKKKYKKKGRVHLKKKDSQRIWALMKEHNNMTLVADLMGVSRMTIYRFFEKFPTPKDFKVEDSAKLTDFPEIQEWFKRTAGFAKKITINNYLYVLRKFFEWMKEYHPERARPAYWTSEDILEYIFGKDAIPTTTWKGVPKHLWHNEITALRSLAKKAQKEFVHIDLGKLPTKKTRKQRRSLAGKQEYYFSTEQVSRMIEAAKILRDKAVIAMLFNLAIRTKALTNARIENVKLESHFAKIRDKGDIIWLTYGMTDKTARLLKYYLASRGNPKEGYLFVNEDGTKMKNTEINKIIKTLGEKAEITDKKLTAKSFRKSFVKAALTPIKDGGMGMSLKSLIGTGGNEGKTCFCVGWSNTDTITQHYAPELMSQIEADRQKLVF